MTLNDTNECDDPSTCIGGTCTNTIGNFRCTCAEGYNKQGNACKDIDECMQPNICPANANCNNFPGLYNCVCHPGYGGAACNDINECLENTDNCHDNATCSNNEGSFDCQCIQGYTGDGTNCECNESLQ
ncbi:fibrillin-2-like isoform X48 [Paramuricea clavata]|uniref:Fibrillin-2-like isoform X48 n=1 Tax=Paramuricea clavata TaxID=317549 RepID=A0A7D9I356_PARCT|nr:fibrillin-2-like isoform X48 [Paramuricea clavata]